jgi:penicillin-binding protein 1A
MMNHMMQETLTTGTARKAALAGFPAAGKTGTSQDYRDAWFIGYTGHLVAGVWLGNDDNTSTKKLTGGAMPADIWNRFMTAAHQGLPMADLPGMAGRTIDPAQSAPMPAAPAVPSMSAPLTSMLAPAAPLAREDDPRPVAPLIPLAPARPPAFAVAPIPPAHPRVVAPPARPPQAMAARPSIAPPPRTVHLAPPPAARPGQIAGAPLQLGNIPRPPGGIGSQPPQGPPLGTPQVQKTATNSSGLDGFILDNIFGRR